MVAQAQRREDLDRNSNQNQGNGNKIDKVSQEIKGTIIDFLEKKEKIVNKRLLEKNIFEKIKEKEDIMIGIYEAFLLYGQETISLKALEKNKIESNTIESLLLSNSIDDNTKTELKNLLLAPLRSNNDYNDIFNNYIDNVVVNQNKGFISALEKAIPDDEPHKKEFFEKLRKIKISYADIIKIKSGNENFHKIESGVKVRFFLKEEEYKEYRDLLSPIVFHQLEKKGNVINSAINDVSGENIMENNSLDMFYYFYNEYNKFILEQEGNYNETNFYNKFHAYLEKVDKVKASIFYKIFIEKDNTKKELSKEEQDNIIDDIKPRLLAYLQKEYQDKVSYETIKKFVENFQVPDSVLQIGDREETINVQLGIIAGSGDNKNQLENFLDDYKLKLNIEIKRDDFEKYPNYLKNRIIIELGEREILLDRKKRNGEITIYNKQIIKVEHNGYITEGALHGVVNDSLLFCDNKEIPLDEVKSIETKNIKKKLKEIEEDVSSFLGNENEDIMLSKEERFKGLEDEWYNIDGSGDFQQGSVLYIALGESNRLKGEEFGDDYIKFTIGYIDRNAGTVEFILSYPSDSTKPKRFNTNIEYIYVSKKENIFRKLENIKKGPFFRANPIKNKGDLLKYITNNSKIEGQDELPIPNELKTFIKENKFDDIAYIGRMDKKMIEGKDGRDIEVDNPLFFKVVFKDDKVILTHKSGGFKTTLTYDEFVIFMSDKKLKPYTAEEEQEANRKIESQNKPKWTFYSLENLFYLFKMPTKELKDKWKRRDERLGTELYGKVIGSKLAGKAFGWVPYMNEVSQEAASQAQHKIKQLIGEYEKHYEENFSHDTIASKAIEKEILHDEKTALKAHKKSHYKALAAYKFAAKKDHPYFRGLNEHAGSGLWVLAILGPNLYEKYKKDFAELKKQAKNNPGDTDLINELAQFEMTFIKSEVDGTGLYPGGTGPGLEGVRDQVSLKVSEGFEDMGRKSNFATKNSSKNSMMKNHRISRWLGGQKGVMKAVYNKKNYNILYKDMVFMSIGGLLNIGAAKNVKTQFDDISKAIGFTPGYYMIDDGFRGGEMFTNLVELITQNLMGGISFKKEIGYDFDKLHFGAEYHERNMEMLEKLDKFWTKHGDKLIEILNMKNIGENDDLFSLLRKENLDKDDKLLIEDYLYKKSMEHSDFYGKDFANSELNNENAYWGENVMNYPRWIAVRLFQTTQGGQFRDEGKYSAIFWDNISREFGNITSKVSRMRENEKESIRKWGTDKVLEFLNGSGRLPEGLESIIKAQAYPKSIRDSEAEKILNKEIDLGKKGKKTFKTIDEIKDCNIREYISNTVYQEQNLYPAKLKDGVKILINFLEALE